MPRASLKVLTGILAAGMVVTPFLGLDSLPRGLRAQIDSERAALASSQTQFQAAQEEVLRDLKSDPDLFHGVHASSQWPDQLSQSLGNLQYASRDMDELSRLEKQNRRADRARAESLLAHERGLRTAAAGHAVEIQKEAAHWVDLKQHLPEALAQMERDHRAIDGYDLAAAAAAVQKAGTDWPAKKGDLDSRLASLRTEVEQSDQAWQASAEQRRLAAAGDLAHLDYATLFQAVETLHNAAAGLPGQAGTVQALAGQLYNTWDKILVDMEVRDRKYDQKIRTVRTHFPDASAQNGQVASSEDWVEVPRATYDAMRGNLGMAIEHKSTGKYDSEAERTAQPAGFAYVAPPSQGSNQYGRWEHRDGRDFWVFYGQYALLRDLLFNHDYRPLDRGDWDGYRSSQSRGQTYYGRQDEAPKYGTSGTATQDRYSGSTFAKGGGFKDSKYATKSGSYRDSKYASPTGSEPPRRFGSGSRPEERQAAPPPRSYRPSPSPRPSYRPSAPRRFGRR